MHRNTRYVANVVMEEVGHTLARERRVLVCLGAHSVLHPWPAHDPPLRVPTGRLKNYDGAELDCSARFPRQPETESSLTDNERRGRIEGSSEPPAIVTGSWLSLERPGPLIPVRFHNDIGPQESVVRRDVGRRRILACKAVRNSTGAASSFHQHHQPPLARGFWRRLFASRGRACRQWAFCFQFRAHCWRTGRKRFLLQPSPLFALCARAHPSSWMLVPRGVWRVG